MQLLAVAAALDRGHHQIFRCNERQIVTNQLFHDLLIHMQPLRDVLHKAQHTVRCKKCLRQTDAAVCRVVQCPLEPLRHGCHGRVLRISDHIAGKRADTFAAHGVALIRHGGRADLLVLERLLDLPVVLQKPDVRRHAASALADGRQRVQNPAVEFPGIRLPADGIAALKAKLCGDLPVHLVDLRRIAVKQFNEAGLRAGRTPAAEETERAQRVLHLLEIQRQILQPQRRTLADGRQLRGLIVCVGKGRHSSIALCESTEVPHGRLQFSFQIPQRLAVKDQICIVRYIAACRAQVNDALRARRIEAVSVNVRHHIMPNLFFPRCDHIVIDGAYMRGQLVHLRLRDGQAQIVLRPRQRNPEPAPRLVAHIR